MKFTTTFYFYLRMCCIALILKEISAGEKRVLSSRVCEWETLQLLCDYGEVIQVIRANYGRTSRDHCNSDNHQWRTDCKFPGTNDILRQKCDGKNSCEVLASTVVFGDPCYGTSKYLEVDFYCQPEGDIRNSRVCGWETLKVDCRYGKVIHFVHANYGRTRLDHCNVENQQWRTDCNFPQSNDIMRRRCDLIQSCEVPATTTVFGDPCYGVPKYLEMDYYCQKEEDIRSSRVCGWETMRVQCGHGEVIHFMRANYGRTSYEPCNDENHQWRTDCFFPESNEIVKQRCDRKHSCEVPATTGVFGDPCVGIPKYLEMDYFCVPE